MRVAAAVAAAPEEHGEIQAALGRQTRPPEEVFLRSEDSTVRAGLEGEADWLWLLDGSAIPRPTALERLLEVAEDPGDLPAPALLASKVVRADGALDPASLPVAKIGNPNLAVAAFERRVLSMRVARRGSLLLRRYDLEVSLSRWPRLNPFSDDLEWTARFLKELPGVLVPTSVAVRQAVPGAASGETLRRLKLLLGGAVELRDKPWFALRFAEEALAGVRARRAR